MDTTRTVVVGAAVISVAASALVADRDTKIEASVTGTGGTLAKAVQDYAVDTAIPNNGVAPTVQITTDADNNTYVNAAELGNATSFTVKASFDRTKVALGDKVLDIHVQHAWQSLTRPEAVRGLLDAYAGVTLQALTHAWQHWRQTTQALHEAVGAPKEAIRVWIHDMPKENWGIAGVSAKELGR